MRYRTLSLTTVLVALAFAQLACIPPQDCMGGDLEVKGIVVDQDGNPVPNAEITISHEKGYSDAFEQTFFSDENGEFVSDLEFMFACETVKIEVESEGYGKWNAEYDGPFDEVINPLPDSLTIELVPAGSQP